MLFLCSLDLTVRRILGGIGIICFGAVFAVGTTRARPNDTGLKYSFAIQVRTSKECKALLF
jgi:hypothetical protein